MFPPSSENLAAIFPVATSMSMAGPLPLPTPLAIQRPSGLNLTFLLNDSNMNRSLPSVASTTLSVRSQLTLAIRRPSGLNANPSTLPSCTGKDQSFSRVSTSQTNSSPARSPPATCFSSGATAMWVRRKSCSSVLTTWRDAKSHVLAKRELVPIAISRLPSRVKMGCWDPGRGSGNVARICWSRKCHSHPRCFCSHIASSTSARRNLSFSRALSALAMCIR